LLSGLKIADQNMSFHSLGIPEISLRHLKAAMLVARHQNLTRAATQLNRSQTAITKAISELETDLKTEFFERTPMGMITTPQGTILVKRIERMAAEFEAAGNAYLDYKKGASQQNNPVFSMEASYKRLASIIAIHDYKDVGVAADLLGITKTAVYTSLRQLEEFLDLPLFERSPYGFSSTAYCRVLVRHLKLAFSQLRHALDELASLNGVTTGHLAVGTLPYSRTILTPRAINRLLDQYPGIKISTEEGPYNLLEAALRSGELDLIIGAIRPVGINENLLTEKLFEDRLSVIARKGHPLENKTNLSFEELQKYSWVLPSVDTPSRLIFDKILQNQGIQTPSSIIETSSLANVRGLLLESDRLALLSEHQIYYEKKYGLLVALQIGLEDTYRPIGITMRAHTPPSPAADLFLGCLRKVIDEMIHTELSLPSIT
jgi:LysR family transcriptional regulator, regulator for genes of the gallate degradation pathway